MPEAIGNRVTGRLIFGFIVITVGVVFMMDELGLLRSSDVLRWWAVIPLGYGLMRLTGFCCGRNLGAGLVFTIAGAWILFYNLGAMAYDPWDFWPVVLILLGLSMVMRSRTHARIGAAGESPDASFSAFALWSASKRRVISQEFRGGDVTAIMGGHEIDLTGAKTVPGGAVIDLFVWWGGVDIRVPEDWSVACDGLALMGAIEDNTRPKPQSATSGGQQFSIGTELLPPSLAGRSDVSTGGARNHLILKGIVVMGGVDIKNPPA